MINLLMAAAFVVMAYEMVSIGDGKFIAMPMATIIAWHFYYLCGFVGEMFEIPVKVDTIHLSILVLATISSLGLLWIQERRGLG